MALYAMVPGKPPASLALIEARRQASTADGRQLRLLTWSKVCFLAQMLGRTEGAHKPSEQTDSLRVELRNSLVTVGVTRDRGIVALACGRAAEAAELLARACPVYESAGGCRLLVDGVLTQGLARSALAWAIAADGDDPATVRKESAAALAALAPTDLLLERALVHAACAEAAQLIGDLAAAVSPGSTRSPCTTPRRTSSEPRYNGPCWQRSSRSRPNCPSWNAGIPGAPCQP